LVAQAPISVTALTTVAEIRRELVDDALSARPLIGPSFPARVVDVGSGNGSPGLPLAIAYAGTVTLLESVARKAAFLRELVEALDVDADVIADRSEHIARGPARDGFDLALARALAPPAVAIELCLPLVRPGGRLILWTGLVDASELSAVARQIGGHVGRTERHGGRMLVELLKVSPTPDRFPRRPGMARKRPLRSLASGR